MYISGKYKAKLEQFYVDKERGISITYMKAMGSILIKSVLPSNHRICHQHPRFMEDDSPFSLTLFIENLKTRFHLFLLTTNQSVLREKGEEHKGEGMREKIGCKSRIWRFLHLKSLVNQ